MIIESQDKTKILNFKNIECIGIGNPLENDEDKFKILVATVSDNEFSIGEYATEERAKEVLQEIIKQYEITKRHEASDGLGTIYLDYTFVYRMPKV